MSEKQNALNLINFIKKKPQNNNLPLHFRQNFRFGVCHLGLSDEIVSKIVKVVRTILLISCVSVSNGFIVLLDCRFYIVYSSRI